MVTFESLAADFEALTREIGLPAVKMERINPTRANVQGRSLASYYDAETLETTRRLYARDFDLFGYSRDLSNG